MWLRFAYYIQEDRPIYIAKDGKWYSDRSANLIKLLLRHSGDEPQFANILEDVGISPNEPMGLPGKYSNESNKIFDILYNDGWIISQPDGKSAQFVHVPPSIQNISKELDKYMDFILPNSATGVTIEHESIPGDGILHINQEKLLHGEEPWGELISKKIGGDAEINSYIDEIDIEDTDI